MRAIRLGRGGQRVSSRQCCRASRVLRMDQARASRMPGSGVTWPATTQSNRWRMRRDAASRSAQTASDYKLLDISGHTHGLRRQSTRRRRFRTGSKNSCFVRRRGTCSCLRICVARTPKNEFRFLPRVPTRERSGGRINPASTLRA